MNSIRSGLEGILEAWDLVESPLHRPSALETWISDHVAPAVAKARSAMSVEAIGVPRAWTLVSAERRRQTEAEGWDAQHDDEHHDGSMLRAAVVYLHQGEVPGIEQKATGTPEGWPWDRTWWKPKGRYENVLRAGALCLAERERCVRAGSSTVAADAELGKCLSALSELDARLLVAA